MEAEEAVAEIEVAAAETEVAAKIEEADPDPTKEAEQGTEVPDTLTSLPERPVTSTGSSGRPLGTVPTVTSVHGGTTRAPSRAIIETLLQRKKPIENLTSSTEIQVLLILYMEAQKYRHLILILKCNLSILFQSSRVTKSRK